MPGRTQLQNDFYARAQATSVDAAVKEILALPVSERDEILSDTRLLPLWKLESPDDVNKILDSGKKACNMVGRRADTQENQDRYVWFRTQLMKTIVSAMNTESLFSKHLDKVPALIERFPEFRADILLARDSLRSAQHWVLNQQYSNLPDHDTIYGILHNNPYPLEQRYHMLQMRAKMDPGCLLAIMDAHSDLDYVIIHHTCSLRVLSANKEEEGIRAFHGHLCGLLTALKDREKFSATPLSPEALRENDKRVQYVLEEMSPSCIKSKNLTNIRDWIKDWAPELEAWVDAVSTRLSTPQATSHYGISSSQTIFRGAPSGGAGVVSSTPNPNG